MVNDDLLRTAAGHLTDRDRQIVRLVAEHRTLTTSQLARVFFDNLTTARHRLTVLWRLRLLDRFRPLVPNPGEGLHAGAYCYVIDELGAWMVHIENGENPKAFRWRRRRQGDAIAYAHSQQLTHRIQANEVFIRLLTHARHHDAAAELRAWRSRPREPEEGPFSAQPEGSPDAYGIRPDGYGHWVHHDQDVRFWLEYDRGTETLGVVTDKLERYSDRACDLWMVQERPEWVAVMLPSAPRERHLRQALTQCATPAATAVWGAHVAPHAPIWLPLDLTEDTPRLRLADLGREPLPTALADAVEARRNKRFRPHFSDSYRFDPDTYGYTTPRPEQNWSWRA